MLQKGFGLKDNQTRDVRKHQQGSNEVVLHLRSKNRPVNGVLLKEKACDFA